MLEKICDKKLNHKIIFHAYTNNNDYVNFIRIPLSKNKNISWYFSSHYVEIYAKGILDTILPWWEPDLSDFNALVTKINTYILFS